MVFDLGTRELFLENDVAHEGDEVENIIFWPDLFLYNFNIKYKETSTSLNFLRFLQPNLSHTPSIHGTNGIFTYMNG